MLAVPRIPLAMSAAIPESVAAMSKDALRASASASVAASAASPAAAAAASSIPALRGLAQVEQDIADTVAESRTLATALKQCEDAAKSALLDRQLERLAKREDRLRDEKAQLRDELKRKELTLVQPIATTGQCLEYECIKVPTCELTLI